MDAVVESFPGTVVAVTHRAERLRGADAVWHLVAGQLVETGPPGVVLTGTGPTARFFADHAETPGARVEASG